MAGLSAMLLAGTVWGRREDPSSLRPGRKVSWLQLGGGPSAVASQPAAEANPREQKSCQASVEAGEEMGPINSHLSLQIGVQVGRGKN